MPIGLVHGLPVGLALVGSAGSEARLLRLARGIELALGLAQDGAFLPPLTVARAVAEGQPSRAVRSSRAASATEPDSDG